MKDTIIKGDGTSRKLKAPASMPESFGAWREQLLAGTATVDLALNEDGCEVVGTPISKANLLADAVKSALGLTGEDPTVSEALGALSKTHSMMGMLGDLHVWRKTVTTGSPINASYTQDEVTVDRTYVESGNVLSTPGLICWMAASCEVTTSSSFTLDPVTGEITQTNPTNYHYGSTNNFTANDLLGKYVRLKYSYGYGPANLNQSLLYYIPTDASITTVNAWFLCDKLEYVNVTPYIPAGTTSTYPVSADRNAYQEGSDAQAAGYTLGDIITGRFLISFDSDGGSYITWQYGDSVRVSDDGTVTIYDPSTVNIRGQDTTSTNYGNLLLGKYVKANDDGCFFTKDVVYFIPSDATLTRLTGNDLPPDLDGMVTRRYAWFVSNYQPVIGCAAIPATTVVDYTGNLGDKVGARIVSYVGTGTYGVNNPTSLTFDFEPKIIFVYGPGSNSDHETITLFNGQTYATSRGSTSTGFSFNVSWSGNSVSWYNTSSNAAWQANQSGKAYKVIAIG